LEGGSVSRRPALRRGRRLCGSTHGWPTGTQREQTFAEFVGWGGGRGGDGNLCGACHHSARSANVAALGSGGDIERRQPGFALGLWGELVADHGLSLVACARNDAKTPAPHGGRLANRAHFPQRREELGIGEWLVGCRIGRSPACGGQACCVPTWTCCAVIGVPGLLQV
jgi:hypothetical protein